jgi:hypothetical protein
MRRYIAKHRRSTWWRPTPILLRPTRLTTACGEGILVKPHANVERAARRLVQPGIKVRGREYLRIIYGPDYTEEAHLARTRDSESSQLGSRVSRAAD